MKGRNGALYDLVARALAEEPSRRRDVIEGGCGGDEALRDEALRIVARRDTLGDFLEKPAAARLDLLAPPAPPLPPDTEVGHYRLERVLGSGGSGAVYEAIQESPHRRVAVKVMAAGLGSTNAVRRFRDEAEMLARLNHPGVAHVYEAGVHGTLPWLAIEYVEDARDVVSFAQGLGLRERVELMARVCDAVHHGHGQGILHGDLKPSNLLVDANGQPKVIDFGVARVLGGDTDAEVAGTPAYMAPELCAKGPRRPDVRSDVYALGAVLYEILAGRRAHEVSGLPLAEALRAVAERAPADPVDPRLRGDLAAIALKALAREPEARYASTAALADDLRRYLAHRPVEAHRSGAARHVLLFARRQPMAFAAIVAVLVVSVAAAVVSGRFAVVTARQRDEAEFQSYVANLAAAAAALRRHNGDEVRHRLESAPPALRGWEWRHLASRTDMSERTYACNAGKLASGAASDDGALLVTANWAMPTRLLVLRGDTGERVADFETAARVDAVAVAPGGALVALGYWSGGRVEVRRMTGEPHVELAPHAEQVRAVDFDRSGSRVLSASYDGTVRISEVATGRPLVEFRGHGARVMAARFDPTGARVCSGDDRGSMRVWRAADGTEERTLRAGDHVEGVAWSPDGTRLAACCFDGSVRLWDTATWTLVVTHTKGHDAAAKAVAFAPDGSTFASGGRDRTVRLWSGTDGAALATLTGHARPVYAVAYQGPERVASFSLDGTVKVWDARPRPSILTGHKDAVIGIGFGADGSIASLGRDGAVRIWAPVTRSLAAEIPAASPRPPWPAGIAPDGSAFVVRWGRENLVHRLPGGEVAGRILHEKTSAVAVARGGSWFALATRDGDVELHRLTEPKERVAWRAHGERVTALVFDGSAAVLASGSASGEIRLWPRGEREACAGIRAHAAGVSALAFDRAGARLATGAVDGTMLIVDARTLAPLVRLRGTAGEVRALAFSPDGTRLASVDTDGELRLWEASTERQLLVLLDRDDICALAWSDDGSVLAAGCGYHQSPGSIVLLEAR